MTDLPLHVVNETTKTITLGWTPPADVEWYTFYIDGQRISNAPPVDKNGNVKDRVTFGKPGVYRVVAAGPEHVGTWPPPVEPPPTGTGVLGLVPNAGFPGSYGPKAAALKPKWIREDNLSDALVQWAKDNGAQVLGLGGPLTNTLVDRYPTIQTWEYDNEPYFRNVNLAQWSVTAREYGKQFRTRYPGKRLLFPTLVQTNGGDYQTNGVWSPWVKQIWDAAPDFGDYFDGWTAHPYNRAAATPDFTTLDKVKAQLAARGFTKPCWVTEIGCSVGTNQYQYTQAQQAEFLRQAVTQLRSRPWVDAIMWYCLRTWGPGYEGSFGLLNQDGTERPSAAVYRALA